MSTLNSIQKKRSERFKTYRSKDNKLISFGLLRDIPLSQIRFNERDNRRKYNQHVWTMADKIYDAGFLGVIVVFESNKDDHLGNPIYDPAEGNHRTDALHTIFGEDRSDVIIPCLVLPWPEYNTSEKEIALEVIIGLNKDNKPWTIMDYIRGWSKTGRKSYMRLEQEIHNNKTKAQNLTEALMSYIFVMGKSTTDTKTLQDGKLKLSQEHKPYIEMMLDTMRDWTNQFGVKKWQLHPTFSANFIVDAYKFLNEELLKRVKEGTMDSADSVLIFDRWLDTVHSEIYKNLDAIESYLEKKGISKKPAEIKKYSRMFLPTSTSDIKNYLEKLRIEKKFSKLIKSKVNPLGKFAKKVS